MTNLVRWARQGLRANPPSPWPTLTLDQLPYAFGQFTYQGLGYGPGIIQTLGQKQETVQADFLGFINGAYKSNGAVFACILTRFLLFSEARFQWRRMQNGRPGILFGTADLDILERPWPNATTGDLLTRALVDVDLSGNFYATRGPSRLGGSRIIRLRPDWITIIKGSFQEPDATAFDPTAELAGYIYHPGGPGSGQQPKVYLPDEVMHFAPVPDPAADYRGMSWIQPVLTEIRADAAMIGHKLMFFENGATPNLVVSLDTGKMDRNTFSEWVDLFESQHEGWLNAYKCLAAETEVALWNGARCRADQIQVGDLVVAWDDAGCPSPGVVVRNDVQPESPMVTVKTERGRVIRTNDRHPFLTNRGWIEAQSLKPGDRLRTGLGWGRPRLQDSVDSDTAWLLGLLTGDGCLVPSSPTVTIAEPSVAARANQIATMVRLPSRPQALHDYRITGIAEMIRSARMNGRRSWEKRAPDCVMTASCSVVCSYISGLVDADGHVSDPGRRSSMELGITSTSLELLRDVQHLLASLGVNASVASPPSMDVDAKGGKSGAPRRHSAHRLSVFGNEQARILSGLLDLAHAGKAGRLTEYGQRSSGQDRSRFDRVASVEFGPPEPTIGLQVDPHHTHVTGGVVTRNTLYLGHGADAKVVGTNLRDLDYSVVQGHGETRIAAAAGVPAIIVGFSEGLEASTYSNFAQARRAFADKTLRPLWRNFCSSAETIVPAPGGAMLWYDDRDIAFLKADIKDNADVQLTQSTAMKLLTDAGFDPDSVVAAITSNDFSQLSHSGLYSVQLQPPGSSQSDNVPTPSAGGSANGNGSQGLASADPRGILPNVDNAQQLAKALLAARAGT